MKILVCISHVPDTTSKINFVNNDTEFDTNGVQYVINPNDEFGLTKAIVLKEQNGAHVTVVNVGGADAEATLRKALAIGADEAIRVNIQPKDGLFVAKQLANVVKQVGYDLIIAGKKGLVEEKDLRIPNMRGIMTARTKALNVVEPSSDANATSSIKFEKPAPKSAVKLISADNLDELINLLHNEAKVI